MDNMTSLDWLNSLESDSFEELKLDFAKDIDDAILRSGMKRVQVADRVGTSPAWITKVLRGDANPTLETMQKLADAVGCRVHVKVVPKKVTNVVWSEVCYPAKAINSNAITAAQMATSGQSARFLSLDLSTSTHSVMNMTHLELQILSEPLRGQAAPTSMTFATQG